jgi:hypothetical protein
MTGRRSITYVLDEASAGSRRLLAAVVRHRAGEGPAVSQPRLRHGEGGGSSWSVFVIGSLAFSDAE